MLADPFRSDFNVLALSGTGTMTAFMTVTTTLFLIQQLLVVMRTLRRAITHFELSSEFLLDGKRKSIKSELDGLGAGYESMGADEGVGHDEEAEKKSALSGSDFPLPQLRCLIGGRNVLASNISDGRLMSFTAENAERRFESHVHNLRARITFKPFKGEAIVVKDGVFAIRFRAPYDESEKEHFTNLTSLGMGGKTTLLAYVVVASRFYTVKKESVHAAMGEELRPGHWEVTVELTADNARTTARYKLELNPDGSSGIGPLVDK